MSDFLDAADEMLADYGETITILNRSGTATGTNVKAYFDPVASYRNYFPEGGENVEAEGLVTAYVAGDEMIDEGYRLARAAGTCQVLEVGKPQDGTVSVLNIAKCRTL